MSLSFSTRRVLTLFNSISIINRFHISHIFVLFLDFIFLKKKQKHCTCCVDLDGYIYNTIIVKIYLFKRNQ